MSFLLPDWAVIDPVVESALFIYDAVFPPLLALIRRRLRNLRARFSRGHSRCQVLPNLANGVVIVVIMSGLTIR